MVIITTVVITVRVVVDKLVIIVLLIVWKMGVVRAGGRSRWWLCK